MILIQLLVAKTYGQFADSLQIRIGTITTFAQNDYQPLWIESLRFGSISNQRSDLSSDINISNEHTFKVFPKLSEKESKIFLNYGVALFNNQSLQNTFFQEAYVKTGYKKWEIRAGRFKEIIGEVDHDLSGGSLAVSGNALPIPKIGVAVTDFIDVPFTKGLLQFKGQFSHGWFGNNHSVRKAFLHEKVFYLKAGGENLSLYIGGSHFAQWGGEDSRGVMPSRFKDYLRIIVGAPGDPNDLVYQKGAGSIDVDNAVGNHQINSDIGIQLRIQESIIRLYTQTIFSKGRGDSANVSRRDDLIGLNMFGKDRMVGLSWASERRSWLEKILVEGIYTKEQGGDIVFNGRFNYYNNATYATGWVYMGQVIGTPLFLSRDQAERFGLDSRGWNIASNRIMGLHLGVMGSIGAKVGYRVLITTVQHNGNYYNDAVFTPPKHQSNYLAEFSYQVNPALFIKAMMAIDAGDLSVNIGWGTGVEWRMFQEASRQKTH